MEFGIFNLLVVMKKKKVVVIGGGTGTTAVLPRLKEYPDLEISVIVSMTDDGGSNAVIRDEFGILPLSDLRKSIIALSDIENGILRKLFVYRFPKGKGLFGHTLGNLMMMALTEVTGSVVDAVEAAKKLFHVKGKVIPVTLKQTTLVAEYDSGLKIKGEHLIDEPTLPKSAGKIKKLFLSPRVAANAEALRAVRTADFIIAGPGDLYTTTLANLIVPGMRDAIQKSRAKFIFISNLMSKFGQTTGQKASDLASEMEKYSGRQPDAVVLHKGKFSQSILKKYAKEREWPIEDDLDDEKFKVVRADLVSRRLVKKVKGDSLKRSLIRHDKEKLGKILYRLISYEKF